MRTRWGRLAALGTAVCLVLGGCAAPAREAGGAELTARGALRAVLESQEDGGPEPLEGEALTDWLTGLYGLAETDWADAAAAAASGADARETAVIRVGPDGDIRAVARALEDYRQGRLTDFFGYLPDQAALVEGGAVVTRGDWVVLLLCADVPAARRALEGYLGGATEGVDTPTPAPVSTPEAASPSPTPAAEEPPAETPEPTPEPTPRPTPPAGLYPFMPPNEGDMTPYDTSAILAAWATGEEGTLDERDGAILARCREALAGITEDMTDFEKELALYRWVLKEVGGDMTSYDPQTPLGLPDSTSPYGALVLDRAVCLGYATTFQLLMDLAGVECITVVGAANFSQGDHAWNMVKLEGEWYCLDLTWSRPQGGAVKGVGYKYFNVTSAFMADTNHQWDYENTPWADATRFRWDGTGPLPE